MCGAAGDYAWREMCIRDRDPSEHHSIVKFLVDNVHPHDVASILDMDHIAVRAGHHCAQPLLQHLNTSATTRASFAFYNTMEEVDALAESLAQVRRLSLIHISQRRMQS